MAKKIGATTQLKAEIPTASMADISFLLIVFFMLTMVFSSTKGVDFRLPEKKIEPNEPVLNPERAVFVHAKTGDILEVDRRPVSEEEMYAYIRGKLVVNPQKPVFILVEKDCMYKDLVKIYDVLMKLQSDLTEEFRVTRGIDRYAGINISIPTHREIELLQIIDPTLFE